MSESILRNQSLLHIKSSAYVSKKTYDDTETRDLKSLVDNLRKELERKENRNNNLSKDVISLRTTASNQEVSEVLT